MAALVTWTPILRSAEGATDTAVEQRLPREPVGEKHPLALPRVKQRERRAVQLLGRRRVDPSRDATATPTTVDSDESMKLDGIDRSGKDPVSALSPQSSSSGTLGKGKTVISEDRTRMVAVAGLSDDPLSVIMEQRAVARNMSRHGGDVLEDEELDSLLPSTRPKTAQASVENPLGGGDPLSSGGKGGSSNDGASKSDGKVEGDGGRERGLGSGSLHSKSPRPSGAKSKSYEEGKEGWRGWSKRWEVHRMTMLREYSEGGALSSGADQAAGPSTPGPKSRFEGRLAELDGGASGGGNSSGGLGGSVGGKSDPLGSGKRLGTGVAGGLLLTPSEYTSHVNGLRSELEYAWANEEKVTALKVTVKAAKLLGDTSVPTFYPSLFAMVAAVLETFGTMVFDRIRSRAEVAEDAVLLLPTAPGTGGEKGAAAGDAQTASSPQKPARAKHVLREGWSCNDISGAAREMCRNWFYKTACIRELLPRILVEVDDDKISQAECKSLALEPIYINGLAGRTPSIFQAALLPCYRFLALDDEFGQILGARRVLEECEQLIGLRDAPCFLLLSGIRPGRLSTLVRGIGDPMVAVYCRCFVSVAGHQIAPLETAHAAGSLQDYLFSLQEVKLGKLAGYLRSSGLGISGYVNLHTPAVDWLVSIVAPEAPRAVFTKILTHYRNHCGSLEILRLILKHFGAEHYGPFALEMAVLIKQGSGVSPRGTTAEVMALLGRRLSTMPPTGPDALPLLNEAWQEISTSPMEIYAEGAAAWFGVLLSSPAYGPDEVAILVEDVACRVESASPGELDRIQTYLAEGIIGALSSSGDSAMLEAAGSHVVKILGVLDRARTAQACLDLLMGFLRILTPSKASTESGAAVGGALPSSHRPAEENDQDVFVKTTKPQAPKENGRRGLIAAGTLIGVAKLLHDGLDVLSSGEQERQSAVSLTSELVDRIGRGGWETEESGGRGGGDDDKTCLALLVECRRAFWAMDEVTERLVLAATRLAVRASRKSRGGGSAGASADATTRAALCFCATTVLSVPSALRRLALLQLSADAALQAGKVALADSLLRSAIYVVPECSTLVVSGADPGAAASSFGRTPSTDSAGFGLSSVGIAGGNEESFWGLSGGEGSMARVAGGSGLWGRKEHAGAWLLADAVRSLLGALVAAPGHPELGPFYLLRGLLKAVRRLPWPSGSGLLASLYISAINVMCAMWQKRLPYSIASGRAPLLGSHDGEAEEEEKKEEDKEDDKENENDVVDEDKDKDKPDLLGDGDVSAGPPPLSQTSALAAGPASNTGDAAGGGAAAAAAAVAAVAVSGARDASPSIAAIDTAVPANGEVPVVGDGDAVVDMDSKRTGREDKHDRVAEGGSGQGSHEGDAVESAAAAAAPGGKENGVSVSASGATAVEEIYDGVTPAAGTPTAGGKDAADLEEKYSWVHVGGLLGTDELYLRNSSYLKEIQGLISDVMRVALRELEELREQGEAEVLSSAMGGGQARAARVRYARLTLDLANQLVSGFRMEGGTANVVVFLIEASARAGAREGGIDMAVAGGGGIDDRRRRRKNVGYFDETVEFVAQVAKTGLERARKAKGHAGINSSVGGNSEAEEAEEASLTLLQGLSGFAR